MASGSGQWQRTYTFKMYFRGWNGCPWWWTEYGGYGRRKNKERLQDSSLSTQVLCYDLWWGREPQPHLSDNPSWCTVPTLCLYCILNKRVKWIWHVWEGEVHNLGHQRALYQWLHWLNSRLIPQRPGQSFCRGLRESISEITSPIDKTTNESLPTLCILEKQRSFHRRTSLSCPWMLWSKLYLKHWIKWRLPGKIRAELGEG